MECLDNECILLSLRDIESCVVAKSRSVNESSEVTSDCDHLHIRFCFCIYRNSVPQGITGNIRGDLQVDADFQVMSGCRLEW